MRGRSMPLLEAKPFKGLEVPSVPCDEDQLVDGSDRGDLAIGKGRRSASAFEACTLSRMPLGGAAIVVQHRKAGKDHVLQIVLDGAAPL